MSIYHISKISRNKYLTDVITACENEIGLSHNEFLGIDSCITVSYTHLTLPTNSLV